MFYMCAGCIVFFFSQHFSVSHIYISLYEYVHVEGWKKYFLYLYIYQYYYRWLLVATPLQTCDDTDCPSMTDKLFQYILFIHFLMNLYIIGIIVMNGAGIVAAATAAILIDVIE